MISSSKMRKAFAVLTTVGTATSKKSVARLKFTRPSLVVAKVGFCQDYLTKWIVRQRYKKDYQIIGS